MTTRSSGISVVIPAYRSSASLPALLSEIDQHVAPLVDSIEVIIVEDGGGDDTWATIEELARTRSDTRGVQLLRNFGQHNALLAGMRLATQPLVLTIDDDLQNPPSEVPRLLDALDESVDLVYGYPTVERQGPARNFASRAAKRVMSGALGPDVYPRSSAFRLFRRELVAAGDGVRDPSISVDVILSWATHRVTDVPVEFADRTTGASGYDFRKLVRHTLNMVTGYSTQPIRFVSAMGLIVSFMGFVALFYVLIRFLLGDSDVAGFTFLATAITLFSGVQLLSLGILGEYVGRVHFRTMGKPTYLIARSTDDAGASAEPPDGHDPTQTDERR